uniref:Uncharacterized protein n=1 Tax=Moniliophthora roreri TaxID=221103 RepID=A0A0W0GB70_MONRR
MPMLLLDAVVTTRLYNLSKNKTSGKLPKDNLQKV